MPTYFRPCIDLHAGLVKQIVGGTLDINEWKSIEENSNLTTTVCNFTSTKSAGHFATRFKKDNLRGGHLIMLGQGHENVRAAKDALSSYPQGLHIGGGMRLENIESWLEAGAAKVILTSELFDEELKLSENRLRKISECIGRQRFVVDLSCSKAKCSRLTLINDVRIKNEDDDKMGLSTDGADTVGNKKSETPWIVCLNGWQTQSKCELNQATLQLVDEYASESLIHSIDNEGLCEGFDRDLIQFLGQQQLKGRIVYAGGINSIQCFEEIEHLTDGSVDVVVGSALDLYGGQFIRYNDCVQWNLLRQSDFETK